MDCSPPGSSVHGIFQARRLQWVAVSFSGGSSQPRDRTRESCIGRQMLHHFATWGAGRILKPQLSKSKRAELRRGFSASFRKTGPSPETDLLQPLSKLDGSGRGLWPPGFPSHTQHEPPEQAFAVLVCRWAFWGALQLSLSWLAPGPLSAPLTSGQPHSFVSPFGRSLWTVSVFESHPLYFIFLCGHLKISSRRDEAPWVGLLLCAYGPWRDVVPHSRLPEAPVVLAPIFSASSVRLCRSAPGRLLQACLLELNTWLWAWLLV